MNVSLTKTLHFDYFLVNNDFYNKTTTSKLREVQKEAQ